MLGASVIKISLEINYSVQFWLRMSVHFIDIKQHIDVECNAI